MTTVFTSDRERRLWLWLAVVMVAIYSSLGLAPMLAAELRERNLLRVSFALFLLLVVGIIAVRWLKSRPGWPEIGVALGVVFVYLVTFARMESPEGRTHLVEYGVVAALIHQALLERVRQGRRVPKPAALTVAATALLGLIDEGIQAMLPNRVFDIADIFFNALAGFMVVVARLAIAPVVRPGWRLWFLWLMAGAFGWGWATDPGSFGESRQIEWLQSIPAAEVPPYLSLAVGATLVAVLQWLVLRRYVARAARWILPGVGAAAVTGLVVAGVDLIHPGAGLVVGTLLFGAVIGALQWFILRRHVTGAGWWVVANTIGWLAAVPVGAVTGPPGWAIYGAITGTVLVWLLRQRPLVAAS